METVVAHVQPSNSNSKKSNVGASTSAVPAAAEAPGSENEAVASAVTVRKEIVSLVYLRVRWKP